MVVYFLNKKFYKLLELCYTMIKYTRVNFSDNDVLRIMKWYKTTKEGKSYPDKPFQHIIRDLVNLKIIDDS